MSRTLGPTIKLGPLPYGILHNVERIRWDGDSVEFSGHTAEFADATELAVRREQLLGLSHSLDMPVLPIIFGDDPYRTSYFTDVEVGVEDPAGVDRLRRLPYTVRARRVPGRDAPLFELLSLGGLRSNSISFAAASADPWIGVPAAVTDFWNGEDADYALDYTRTLGAGVDGVGISLYTTTGNARRLATYTLPIDSYYDGACKLTLGGEVVTGRQVWDTDADANDWSITNGIVTVSPAPTSADKQQFRVVGLTGTGGGTSTTKDFRFYFEDTGSQVPDSFTTLTVIDNRPEVARIRLGMRVGTTRYRIVMDITVRRGARLAEFTWRMDESFVVTVDRGATADAATAMTGGLKDGSSPRWLMISPNTVTAGTVQGELALTSAGTRLSVGLGIVDGTSGDDDNANRDQYFGALEARQLVVGR